MRTLLSLFCSVLAAYAALSSPIRDNSAARNLGYISDSEIVPIAYLESTGEQYLLLPEAIDGIDCFILPQANYYHYQGQSVGRYNGASRTDAIVFQRQNGYGLSVSNGSNSPVYTYDMSRNHLFHVVVHGTAVDVDGIAYTMGAAWASNPSAFKTSPFALFGSYRTDTKLVQTQSCRIGRCALYVGDELLYDLVPMRKGSEGFFLDLVSGDLYRNQGSGSFIIGPDL